MPSAVEKPKRGRPPKLAAEKLRDRIWIHAVRLRSSFASGYMLEKTVEAEKVKRQAGQVMRPRKWDRYLNGERGPGKVAGRRDSVTLAEAEFPGTACWHRSPLWQALSAKPMTAAACEAVLHRLDIDVAELLLTIDSRAGADAPRPRGFDQTLADQLVAVGSFDALAAAIVLVRWSEAIASPQLRDLALACYGRLQPVIATLPEIAPFHAELFSLIDARCKHWVYPAPNQRLEVVIFWQGMRDTVWRPDPAE